MSITFTKLFSSITESTIWCEDAEVRIVWITMLAMCDKNGRVWGSIPGLANRARVSIEKAEEALQKFLSPDTYSRTKEYDGRRIEEIDGGWRLLNHEKYRAMRDEEERKAYKREWIAKKRAEEKESVDNVDRSRPQYTNTDTEAYTDTDPQNIYTHDFETAWSLYPKRAGANPKKKAFRAWSARLKGGAPPEDMLAGIRRYSKFIKETGKSSTEFIMQAATFLGPDEHYLNDWGIPDQRPDEIRPRNDADWMGLGQKIGVNAGRGESMQDYIKRIQKKLQEQKYA